MKNAGFSLIEVVIVVAIIGILAAIALPGYQESVRKGNRSDGQAALLEATSRMERYFYDNNTYTTDLRLIGYSSEDTVETSEGHYTLAVDGAPTDGSCPITTCFTITATAINAQVADGDLSINSLGQKTPTEKW